MYFPPEVDFLHSWANFQADRLYKSNDNVVASRHIKREEVLLPVAVRHSKTPVYTWQRKRHAFRARRNGFFGENFLFRISE